MIVPRTSSSWGLSGGWRGESCPPPRDCLRDREWSHVQLRSSRDYSNQQIISSCTENCWRLVLFTKAYISQSVPGCGVRLLTLTLYSTHLDCRISVWTLSCNSSHLQLNTQIFPTLLYFSLFNIFNISVCTLFFTEESGDS